MTTSAEYWDVGMWKETKTGKNWFTKIGSARQNDDGGFTCFLDALPLPGPKGGCNITIKPQRDRQGGGFGGGQGRSGRDEYPPASRATGFPEDDGAPF